MKGLFIFLLTLLIAAQTVCAAQTEEFKLSSSSFAAQGTIPKAQLCNRKGENRSPMLSWTAPPRGTQSLALVCRDPDAPGGNFIHWVYFNIPPSVNLLKEGIARSEYFSNGSQQGINSFNHFGYDGPCPPPGKPHHYIFTLYAVDTHLNLGSNVNADTLKEGMEGHILNQTELVGIFQSN